MRVRGQENMERQSRLVGWKYNKFSDPALIRATPGESDGGGFEPQPKRKGADTSTFYSRPTQANPSL